VARDRSYGAHGDARVIFRTAGARHAVARASFAGRFYPWVYLEPRARAATDQDRSSSMADSISTSAVRFPDRVVGRGHGALMDRIYRRQRQHL